MAAVAIDVPYLSAFYSIPQATLTTLGEAPTIDLVNSLLVQIEAKAHESDEIRAEKLRLEVELENAVRSGQSKARVLKSSVDKGLKEIEDLRSKLKGEGKQIYMISLIMLNTDDLAIRGQPSTSSTSVSEVSELRSRISSLESANRDTVSLLEAKSTAHDRLAEELSTQHRKTLKLRREVSELEQSLQQASSASATAKYREQSLQQEIDSLKRSNDWYETELKTKSTEYLKYRKEKGSRIVELQRQNEDANSNIESLKRTESTLRNRLEEISQKADDAFGRIQQMQEDAAKTEEAFRVELDSANRLAELQKASADTAKQRMLDLQSSLEHTRTEAADEIGQIRAEMETEHMDREAAERRVLELEIQVERLEADLTNNASMPTTPHRGINGTSIGTPGHVGSPFSSSTSRMKGSLSFTQMYSEYTTAKAELEAERRRNDKLSGTIDEMIQDLESRQPEIQDLRADHTRLESEIVEMSKLADEVGKERDKLRKDSRKWEGQVEGLTKEGEVLRQQLRDLSAQIKVLLMEVHTREQGSQGLSTTDHMILGRLARGEVDDDALEGMTDTDRFISNHLATFKNVRELQEQNTKLLRLTRELGQKMEGEEAQAKESQQAQDREELESLREKVERYKDEMKSMVTQSQSFIRERDMFRRMLSHRGQLPPGTDLTSVFGQSVDSGAPPRTPPPGGVLNSIEQSPGSKDSADYLKLLKEMQAHFDSYRSEAAADRSALKQQLDNLAKKNGELQAETARSNSQLILAHERYEMLQANYAMLKSENQELQRRSQGLAENAAKQDLRTQQVAEDLVEAKGMLESMRNESANLKAEKEFWKSVEKRLTEENENLSNERARLNTLHANLQNLINEREHSDSEIRRRLQTQVESLESELQNNKRKLDSEIEDAKKSVLRWEYEHQQSQRRIDDLVASLGSVREELVAAKTSRDHLQARVNELAIEAQSAEERVQVLQARPTPRQPATATDSAENGVSDNAGSDVSKEQELAVEVSELKRNLQLAKGELENAKAQVDQYKAISQSTEEELGSLNETQEQYRVEMDRVLEEKENKIRDLEHRLEDVSSELSSTNSQLSNLRDEQTEASRRLEEQKSTFEAEIARLKDEDERHAAAAHFHQEDLKVQAEIAQQAQQNYENELVKHAEAAKALQKVRTEYNQLKLEVVELRTEAETAKANLVQNEESWTERKERFERELADMRTRREEVNAQNKLLHQQLENVSGQISALQQKRAQQLDDADTPMSPSSSLDNVQEVIRYLRREKEIVDVQYELSVQEARRLKQQLDYAQSQLDETRLKLDQQRRAQGESERSTLNHNKLIETMNELNLFRESSVTLRNEARQAQTSLAEKTKRVEELLDEIQPLQTKVRELENQKEIQEGEMQLLQEDRDRWQQRTQNILQKYDRVDPAEMDSLKEQIATLQKEREELEAAKQPLQEQVDSFPERLKQVEAEASQRTKERLGNQFKARSKELSAKANERNAALQAAVKEKEELEQQLSSLNGELDAAKAERDEAIARVASNKSPQQAQAHESTSSNGIEEGQVDEYRGNGYSDVAIKALEEKLTAAEARAETESHRAESLQNEVDSCRSRITELEQKVEELQKSVDESISQLLQLRAEQQQPTQMHEAESQEHLDNLMQQLSQAQQEIERLKADASIKASIIDGSTEDGSKSVAEQVTEQVDAIRSELEARHLERVQQAESQFKNRADQMKQQLSKKLTEGKEAFKQVIAAEHKAALDSLTEERQKEVGSLKAQHQEELEVLRQNEETRFEQFKETWLAEHAASDNAAEGVVKNEPQTSQQDWTPTESQVKELVANNPTIKAILSRNIRTKLDQERASITARIEEEQYKLAAEQIDELQRKASKAREDAVQMEAKRHSVKLSMTENRARAALAKIEVVQKAAEETPQRPVVEVWAIAKDVKPAPVVPPQPQGGVQALAAPQASTFGQPTPLPGSLQGQPTIPNRLSSLPQAQTRPLSAQGSVQQRAFSKSSPSFALQGQPLSSPTSSSNTSTTPQQSSFLQSVPDLPAKPPQTQPSNQPNAGPAANRTLLSGIPRGGVQAVRGARGGRGGQAQNQFNQPSQLPQAQNQDRPQSQPNNTRETGIPRGSAIPGPTRGRGAQARGASQQVQTSSLPEVQNQAQRSPGSGRGAMNAAARQFIPQGNKRGREEGQDGSEIANGKRFKNDGS